MNGSGFVIGSVVNWNGSPRTTTFVSATQLQAAILSADVATAGTAQVNTSNAGSSGLAPNSSSPALPFTITAATPGLTAAYGFSEGSGATTADTSGNGNTGQIRGATWTSGKYGNALKYDGAASYVDLGSSASLQSTGSMSWSAWVYLAAFPSGDGALISRYDGTSGWELKATSTGGITDIRRFRVQERHRSGDTTEHRSSVPEYLVFGRGVYDASRKALDIYVNGVLADGTLQGKVPASQTLSNANTTIGRNAKGSFFNGIIDELRVYSRALSAADIQGNLTTPINTISSTALSLTAAKLVVTTASDSPLAGLSCSPKRVDAGGEISCELRLKSTAAPSRVSLHSNGEIKIPAEVTSRPNQSTLRFVASTDASARQQWAVVTANLGESTVEDRILIASAGRPILRTAKSRATKTDKLLNFDVSAIDPADLPVRLGAAGVPAGASFDVASGHFEWTPTASQAGTHHITFSATNSLQQSSATEVTIQVTRALPFWTSPRRSRAARAQSPRLRADGSRPLAPRPAIPQEHRSNSAGRG